MATAARGLTVAATGFVLLVSTLARPSMAEGLAPPGSDRLAEARTWFADALRDEEAGRYSDALSKFQRVRDVRETAPVEYRIGTCYDGLGQPVPAYVAYRKAVALGQGDPSAADVVEGSKERLDLLGKVLGRLTIALAPSTPHDVEVRVDEVVVGPSDRDVSLPLAPGRHVVTATATGRAPFRASLPLAPGTDAWLAVSLETASADSPPPGSSRAVGWIVLAGGASLLSAASILLAGRQSAITTLHSECPEDVCPPGINRGAVESTRDRALAEGPIAAACGIGGVIAAGAGAWLVLSGSRRQANSTVVGDLKLAPAVGPHDAGMMLQGAWP